MANNEIFCVLKLLKIVGCDHCCLLSSSYELQCYKVYLTSKMVIKIIGEESVPLSMCYFPVLKAETMR